MARNDSVTAAISVMDYLIDHPYSSISIARCSKNLFHHWCSVKLILDGEVQTYQRCALKKIAVDCIIRQFDRRLLYRNGIDFSETDEWTMRNLALDEPIGKFPLIHKNLSRFRSKGIFWDGGGYVPKRTTDEWTTDQIAQIWPITSKVHWSVVRLGT